MPRKPSPLPEVAVLQSTFVLKDGRLINKFSRTARKAGCFADASNSRGYRTVYVAQFPTKEEAQAALNPVREELHGEYARAA